MAATAGLSSTIQTSIINTIAPNSGTVAFATTVTGPVLIRLTTTTSANNAAGTECADSNYISLNGQFTAAAATTNGAGTAGFTQKSNSAQLVFFNKNSNNLGATASQTLTGCTYYSSDGTPVYLGYYNFAATVSVPAGSQYTVAVGSATFGVS